MAVLAAKHSIFFLEANKNKNVVIEVELHEDEMARRRIGFYERHRMTLIDKEYLQPPYQSRIRLSALATDGYKSGRNS